MSKSTSLILGLNVLLAATLIGTISQSSVTGAPTSESVTSACANIETGVLRLPTGNNCAPSEKRVTFGSTSTPQNAVKTRLNVGVKNIGVFSTCPKNKVVTHVSYNYAHSNELAVMKMPISCQMVTVLTPP